MVQWCNALAETPLRSLLDEHSSDEAHLQGNTMMPETFSRRNHDWRLGYFVGMRISLSHSQQIKQRWVGYEERQIW